MTEYVLSRSVARKMLSGWQVSSLALNDISGIHNTYKTYMIFNPLVSGSTVSLQELQPVDVVRLYLTPGHEVEQEDLVPYGNILKHIIDVASGPVPTEPDNQPKFSIVYE